MSNSSLTADGRLLPNTIRAKSMDKWEKMHYNWQLKHDTSKELHYLENLDEQSIRVQLPIVFYFLLSQAWSSTETRNFHLQISTNHLLTKEQVR